MTAITAARFAEILPEFSPVPGTSYEPWVTAVRSIVDPFEWGDLYEIGAALWIAHQVTMDKKSAASGGAPIAGAVSTKRVDKVAVGYDTGSVSVAGAGSYNATSYGVRFLEFQRIIGVGPLVV